MPANARAERAAPAASDAAGRAAVLRARLAPVVPVFREDDFEAVLVAMLVLAPGGMRKAAGRKRRRPDGQACQFAPIARPQCSIVNTAAPSTLPLRRSASAA